MEKSWFCVCELRIKSTTQVVSEASLGIITAQRAAASSSSSWASRMVSKCIWARLRRNHASATRLEPDEFKAYNKGIDDLSLTFKNQTGNTD